MDEKLTSERPTRGLEVITHGRGFAPGQVIRKRFTLSRILGHGGMGVVWLAQDQEMKENVALKFVPQLMLHDRAAMEDLRTEAINSRRLTHPNIVRIHGFEKDDDVGFILMEYIDGDTLRNLQLEQPEHVYQAGDIEKWVLQFCEALSYAHEKAKIIHHDIKPANLMLNKKGDLKVTDFGISRSISESMTRVTSVRNAGGTLPFMSPQQMDNEAPRALDDIYAVGATIYTLLTSKPPFYSGDIYRLVHEKAPLTMTARRKELGITGKPIPRKWEETMAACLAKDPARRPQSVSEIARRLGLLGASAAPSKSVIVLPDMGDVREKLAAYRKPILIGAAVVAALLMAVAGYFFYGTTIKNHVNGGRRLVVETVPSGARVSLLRPGDGTSLGPARTGWFMRNKTGKYDVKFAAEGYKTWTTNNVEIHANRATSLGQVRLSREFGVVEVISQPEGAEVLIDGKSVGLTPLKPLDIPTGNCKVSARYPGWAEARQSVVVKKGENGNAQKVPFKFVGSVNISSDPPGAMILENGRELGLTPYTIANLPPGNRDYLLRLPGYPDKTLAAEVKSESTTAHVKWDPKPMEGSLVLRPDPDNALLEVDGKATSLENLKQLAVGPHTLKVHLNGFETWTKDVVIKERQTIDLGTVTLTPVPVFGVLNIEKTSEGVTVTVKDSHGQEFKDLERLPPGAYTVSIEKDGFDLWDKKGVHIVGEKPTNLGPVTLRRSVGTLNVTSQTEGVGIFINGERRGTTPLKPFDLPTDKYDVIAQYGGVTQTNQVAVTKGTSPLNVEFDFRGDFSITSEPTGAAVKLNGTPAGMTSEKPLMSPKRNPGKVKLVASLKGYEDQTIEPEVAPVKTTRVHVKLTSVPVTPPLPVFGALTIKADPAEAKVVVMDSDERKVENPVEIKPGFYTVRISLDGYETKTLSKIEVRAGQTTQKTISLTKGVEEKVVESRPATKQGTGRLDAPVGASSTKNANW